MSAGFIREIEALRKAVEALEKRVAELEARRGPGRPKAS